MRGPRSLRLRLTLWYALVLAVCLGLYAAAVYVVLSRHLYGEMDLRLHEEAEDAANRIVAAPDGTLSWRGGAGLASVEEEPGGGRWLEVWSPDGKLLLSAASTGSPLGLPPPSGAAEPRSLPSSSGRERALSKAAVLGGRAVVIRAARAEEPIRRQLRELLAGLVLVLPAALAAFGVLGYGLVRRLLAPIEQMAERARRITAERLGERLPVENPEDELGRLAATFNETFSRLERSFEQLRRFTADASHELRTPLTALRSVGEVGLQGAKDEAGYREVVGSMLEEADRLTRLVDTLLVLARGDAGEVRLSLEDLDLGELARDVCSQLGVLAEERGQRLTVEAREATSVRCDPLVLRHALLNLVDNAIEYGPEDGSVRVVVGRRGDGAIFEVIDEGPGIPEAHRERIFDRFYRVDRSRSRERGGAGLGLALVRWAAEAHGGRVELDSREGAGSTFRVVLPGAPPPPGSNGVDQAGGATWPRT